MAQTLSGCASSGELSCSELQSIIGEPLGRNDPRPISRSSAQLDRSQVAAARLLGVHYRASRRSAIRRSGDQAIRECDIPPPAQRFLPISCRDEAKRRICYEKKLVGSS